MGILSRPLILSVRHFLRVDCLEQHPAHGCCGTMLLQHVLLFCFVFLQNISVSLTIYLLPQLDCQCHACLFLTTVLSWHSVDTQYILGERSKLLNKWVWSLGGGLELEVRIRTWIASSWAKPEHCALCSFAAPVRLTTCTSKTTLQCGRSGGTHCSALESQSDTHAFQLDFPMNPDAFCTYYMFWARKIGDLAVLVKDEIEGFGIIRISNLRYFSFSYNFINAYVGGLNSYCRIQLSSSY